MTQFYWFSILAGVFRSSKSLGILSFQANTSAKDPKELDGLVELETERPDVLAELMLRAYQRYNTPFYGGCCGTDASHIACLATAYISSEV